MTKEEGIQIAVYMSPKLKRLITKARDVTGESQSSFIRKSVTEKLERLNVIQQELES